MRDDIAIVGMACRYPDARTPQELWENALAGRQAFRRIPPERLRLADYYAADRGAVDHIYSTEAAVLEGYEFDRVRFRVAGPSYRGADLAHWLALDVAAAALADAGFPEGEGLPRATTGVLLGNTLTGEFSRANLLRLRWPYVRRIVAAALAEAAVAESGAFLERLEALYKEPFPEETEESLAGALSNTIAGRICNHFDLGGGGYTVDGACASSLLAVAQVCSGLAAGDLDVALAGGVDLSLDPFELVGFARAGALAPGAMRIYDARSQGFIPGEGCGIVVLMRLADARTARLRVRGVIRGWGISSDGRGGLTRPEVEGQMLALARAYAHAGIGIGEVAYLEGHGTGTAVGDTAELEALSCARRVAAGGPPPVVGSVKAIVGHTKAAAGVAGLIKATLALESQVLPPTIGCESPHPLLTGPEAALRVLERGEAWPVEAPLVAGVSAMGFGGINAHVVLAGVAETRRAGLAPRDRLLAASPQDAELLLLAADATSELAAAVERLARLVPRLSSAELGDLAARLAGEVRPGWVRAAVVAGSPAGLARRLERLTGWLREGTERRLDAADGLFLGSGDAAPRLGFLFPGQGAPAPAGGGALAHRFAAAAELYAGLELPRGDDRIATDVAQPAIVAASLAALRVLRRLGIEAEVGVGHSLGELTALCWAGALGEHAAVRVAAARGRAMAEASCEVGEMASLAAAPEAVEPLLAGSGLVVAAYNAPAATVVSGPAAAVEDLIDRARAAGLVASRLAVSHAFHTEAMAAAAPRLATALGAESLLPPARQVVSTVTGEPLPPEADLVALLVDQLTKPVRFAAALSAAGAVDLWIEVGPGRVTSGLAPRCEAAPALALATGGSALRGLLEAAGAAFALGAPVAVAELFAGRFVRPFDPERPLRFLASPCERAPLPAEALEPVAPAREQAPSARQEAPPAVSAPQPAAEADPLAVVRALVAEHAELPLEAVAAESRLLADLHLNSIAVGQLVGEASRRLGRAAPAAMTEFAGATVREVARALAEQPRRDEAAAELERWPAGVDTWVRPFTVEWVEGRAPVPRPIPGGGARGWQVVAPPRHPLAEPLRQALETAGGGGVAVCLAPEPDDAAVGLLLAAARAVEALPRPVGFLVVQGAGWGGGFARTLHLEWPHVATAVVELAFAEACGPADLAAIAGRAAGEVAAALSAGSYREARYDAAGRRTEPILRLLGAAPAITEGVLPLGPEDVLLVTGGGKGIGAECALALARASGARLAILGRSRPEEDGALAANLERLRAAGIAFAYLSADVTDPTATAIAVRAAEQRLGPITAVLHAAGNNVPCAIAALDEEAFRRTLAPKVDGLAHLLWALDPARLRLLVAFGSIIGRAGLPGEADYATANEWLARRVEAFAAAHPACRCLTVEWSVWSGVGMGERLGRVEALLRQGITPISPEAGAAALLALLRRPLPVSSIVVCGRVGEPPTLRIERAELPLLRFLETPRVHVPGVELVVDCELSADADPYLADHRLGDQRLLPAVLGLEAMAQAAMAVAGQATPPVFEEVAFLRPMALPAEGHMRLRVAVLVRAPGWVEAVLRCAATGFAADHFRATCRFGERRTEATVPAVAEVAAAKRAPRLPLDPESELYGDLLFHGGRFRRLAGYRRLRATECLAEISPDGQTDWFSPYLPAALVLGDPGARDAALHGVQVCVPHSTLLPVAVERIETARLATDEACRVSARERRREGSIFIYDLEIVAAGGACERWQGLSLRAVTAPASRDAWPLPLLAPYVERRLEELLPAPRLAVAVERAAGRARRAASDQALAALLGEPTAVARGPDGRPEGPGGRSVSVAHAQNLVLAVTGRGPLGCDLELVGERAPEIWRDLLGSDRLALAALLAGERGEASGAAATRVWAAAECLKKAGLPAGAPLVLASVTPDGWVLLRSGRLTVATLVTGVAQEPGRLTLAIAAEESR